MDAVLRALAEPRRRDILPPLVWTQELPAGDIAAQFDVTRPAISQHLRVLKSAGLIREWRAGNWRLYRADQARLSDVLAYLGAFSASPARHSSTPPKPRSGRGNEGEQGDRRGVAHRSSSRFTSRPGGRRCSPTSLSPRRCWRLDGRRRDARREPRRGFSGSRSTPAPSRPAVSLQLDLTTTAGVHLGWDTLRRILFRPGSSTVEVELTPDGTGTLLRLRHRRALPADALGDHGHGWQHFLARLAVAATSDDPGPDAFAAIPAAEHTAT